MHAIIPPSSAHRWVNCPGSIQAEQQYPSPENELAREGTAAHWVAESVLSSYKTDSIKTPGEFIGQTAPNGMIITEEMCDGAEVYVMDVLKVCNDGGYLQLLRIEEPVTIPRVHELNWGTPDCVIWDESKGRLIVWDFKFGHVAVEMYENWQLIEYAIGALDGIAGIIGANDQNVQVEMRIVQPRAFHPEGTCRDWTLSGSNLRGYANQLATAAELSQKNDPPCKAGEWCDNCGAAHACVTLQREAARVYERVQSIELVDLTPENASFELTYLERAKELVDARLDALTAQSLEQVKSGTVIPGKSIGYGRGSTVWSRSDGEVIALGDLLGIELRKPEAPITPNQAKKLNVDHAVINSYCEQRKGAARLVNDKDTIAARIFRKN